MPLTNSVPQSPPYLPRRAVGACRRGRLRVRLVQISFFRLADLDSTRRKQVSDQGEIRIVPKGRLRVSQDAILGLTKSRFSRSCPRPLSDSRPGPHNRAALFPSCGSANHQRRFKDDRSSPRGLFGFDQAEHQFGSALPNHLAMLIDARKRNPKPVIVG
jgi:hypothetical protein